MIDLTGEQVTLKAIDIIRLKPILSALPEITIPEEATGPEEVELPESPKEEKAE